MTRVKSIIRLSVVLVSCAAAFAVTAGALQDSGKNEVPIIFNISDAISPGESLILSGNHFYDNASLKVAYAKNTGNAPGAFDVGNPPHGVKYLDAAQLSVKDSVYENGIILVFPYEEEPGVYDFWVNNGIGWSNGVTMNAPRPLYIDQEAAYEGLPVQLVGRNLFRSEYGAGTETESVSALRVKLVRIGDSSGAPDGIDEEVVLSQAGGGIRTSVKYTAAESHTGEAIADTNPYKITFTTPSVEHQGTFAVYVSAGGGFYPLEEGRRLVIVEKKAQSWSEAVFGDDYASHIGNDPLDLKAYWAQDFNYANIRTISPNADASSDQISSKTLEIQMAVYDLANNGGGVIHLTEGDYYLRTVALESNVLIVGDGTAKTRVYNADNAGGILFYSAETKSNLGLARFSIGCSGVDAYPDAIVAFNDDTDVKGSRTKNKFLADMEITSKQEVNQNNQGQRCTITMVANRNQIVQNVKIDGGSALGMYTTEYSRMESVRCRNVVKEVSPHLVGKYAIAENFFFDMGGTGHGISVRSETYCAYGKVINGGNRNPYSNDGEVVLAECPGTTLASGNVSGATARSVTVTVTSGGKSMVYGPDGEITHAVDSTTYLPYNRYAVYISKGRGVGQMRYIRLPEACPGFTATYELLDTERDWDVVPDETSTFVIMVPISRLTVYRIHAQDCNGPICLYFTCTDTLVKDCVLKDTGGIAITTVAFPTNVGMQNGYSGLIANIRVESNVVRGVTPQYNDGQNNKEPGGILVFCDDQWSERIREHGVGMVCSGITIRNNDLDEMTAAIPSERPNLGRTGISIMTNGGDSEAEGEVQNVRYVVIENNRVGKSEWGIAADARVSGLVVRNNDIGEVTHADDKPGADMFPKGHVGNPWKVGDNATAATNGAGRLIIGGSGAVTSTPWARFAAAIGELEVSGAVTDLGETTAALPNLTHVNGLSVGAFNSAALGLLKASGFSAIAVDPETRTAELAVVVSRADSPDAPTGWKPIATNRIAVAAESAVGFFRVASEK